LQYFATLPGAGGEVLMLFCQRVCFCYSVCIVTLQGFAFQSTVRHTLVDDTQRNNDQLTVSQTQLSRSCMNHSQSQALFMGQTMLVVLCRGFMCS